VKNWQTRPRSTKVDNTCDGRPTPVYHTESPALHERKAAHRAGPSATADILVKQVIAPGAARRYAPRADGSLTRGGSTSIRGRVRSPPMAKLQAARVPLT